MSRADTLRKLLALGDMPHSSILIIMGGDIQTVIDAINHLISMGQAEVARGGYGTDIVRLKPTVRESAFA